MHRYRTVAQISLIFSILNLVLAAPIVVREKREARRDEMVVVEDVAAMPEKWRKLEAVDLSPRTSSGAASPSESMFDGYTPPLSSGSPDSASNYLWLLESQDEQPPAPLHDPSSPHLSSPGSLEIPGGVTPSPEELRHSLSLLISSHLRPLRTIRIFPSYVHPPFFQPPSPPPPFFLPPSTPPSPPPTHPSSPGTSGPLEIPPSPQHMGSDLAPTETYSPPHHFSASDGWMPSPEPVSGELVPIPEGLAPLHHLPSDGSTPSPSSPPTETLLDKAKFLNKNVMKKVGIVAGAVIAGGTLAASVVTSQKHHQHRDCQDS